MEDRGSPGFFFFFFEYDFIWDDKNHIAGEFHRPLVPGDFKSQIPWVL